MSSTETPADIADIPELLGDLDERRRFDRMVLEKEFAVVDSRQGLLGGFASRCRGTSENLFLGICGAASATAAIRGWSTTTLLPALTAAIYSAPTFRHACLLALTFVATLLVHSYFTEIGLAREGVCTYRTDPVPPSRTLAHCLSLSCHRFAGGADDPLPGEREQGVVSSQRRVCLARATRRLQHHAGTSHNRSGFGAH